MKQYLVNNSEKGFFITINGLMYQLSPKSSIQVNSQDNAVQNLIQNYPTEIVLSSTNPYDKEQPILGNETKEQIEEREQREQSLKQQAEFLESKKQQEQKEFLENSKKVAEAQEKLLKEKIEFKETEKQNSAQSMEEALKQIAKLKEEATNPTKEVEVVESEKKIVKKTDKK